MGGSSGSSAVERVLGWAGRNAWVGPRDEVLGEHFGFALEDSGLTFEEFGEDLDEHLVDSVFACALEDFLARRFKPGERNIIDEYLEHRGWQATPEERAYLLALRDSVLSLYEVLDADPGHGLVLRDLVRPGPDVEVREVSASKTLVRWDRIGCRVLDLGDRKVISGGALRFAADVADQLLEQLAEIEKRMGTHFRRKAELDGFDLPPEALTERILTGSAFMFSTFWLTEALEALAAPPPELHNFDGDRIVFATTRFHLASGAAVEVERRLNAHPDLERDGAERGWRWIGGSGEGGISSPGQTGGRSNDDPPEVNLPGGDLLDDYSSPGSPPPMNLSLDSLAGLESRSLGHLQIEEEALVLETNSHERAERGKVLLESLLAGLCQPGVIELDEVEDALARRSAQSSAAELEEDLPAGEEPSAGVPPDVEEEVLRDFKDNHYRAWLETEIPALEHKTPRRAMRSKSGRARVLRLLKDLESRELRFARGKGIGPYDTAWIWRELGLEDERPSS
jgi:hypothetical protein